MKSEVFDAAGFVEFDLTSGTISSAQSSGLALVPPEVLAVLEPGDRLDEAARTWGAEHGRRLEAALAGSDEPWTGEVPVASTLEPDQTGVFTHSFAGAAPAGVAHPNVRASVLWMRKETTRRPDYTKAGGVPHPSNLPLEHGGVSGADVVATPNPE